MKNAESIMPPGRDNIPPTHPRRIAQIAHLPAATLAHESPEVQRLCAEFRAKEAAPQPTHPKPLPCRIGELLKEWKQVRDDFKKKGNDEAALAVECCAENLYEVMSAFFADAKAWREKQTQCLKQHS